jgi:hypothetical protein
MLMSDIRNKNQVLFSYDFGSPDDENEAKVPEGHQQVIDESLIESEQNLGMSITGSVLEKKRKLNNWRNRQFLSSRKRKTPKYVGGWMRQYSMDKYLEHDFSEFEADLVKIEEFYNLLKGRETMRNDFY